MTAIRFCGLQIVGYSLNLVQTSANTYMTDVKHVLM